MFNALNHINPRMTTRCSRFALLLVSLNCCFFISSAVQWAAPVLEIDDEAKGYLGTINERNVLVDLQPHLQIKNINAINGICSYHVFKPNTEEFPFTIDIKDKSTGEAVIELIKKDAAEATPKDASNNKPDEPLLDCNKRKEFHFLLQAHDCSSPSLASNKVPVKIEVLDHDDSELKFESSGAYSAKLVKSDDIYDNFLQVRASDSDCTNGGYACSYQLAASSPDVDVASLPFKVDNSGYLSTTRSLNKAAETFVFNVRAFDCVSKDSYVETQVTVDIVEPCVPQWTDVSGEVQSSTANTNVFANLKATTCESEALKSDAVCQIDNVNAKVILQLDPSIVNACETEKCGENAFFKEKKTEQKAESKLVLFTSEPKSTTDEDDDSLEDDESNESNSFEDSNKVVPIKDLKQGQQAPLNYRTFSKVVENAEKIANFDGKFGNEFSLSAWIRRPANADKSTKEQVFCGTDSELMNRHHYGLYFYKGNIKFLLRHEPSAAEAQAKNAATPAGSASSSEDDFNTNQKFWPSLWEWSLSPKLLTDNQWHFYEVKFSYPNASLFVDGVKFVENVSNSDIIDAYELNSVSGVGPINTYVGACYHARTHSLIDHFEGDISEIVLTTKKAAGQPLAAGKVEEPKSLIKCSKNCREYIEMNLIGNENYIQSIQNSNQNEITIQTSNLNDMMQIIRKVSYNNKDLSQDPTAARNLKIVSSIHCSNTGKSFNMNEVNVKLSVDGQKQEYNVQIEGDKELTITKDDLTYGLEVFKHISIQKNPINKIDSGKEVDLKSITDQEESDETSDDDDNESSSSVEASKPPVAEAKVPIKFSQCTIKITPERNLMAPTQNNEKLMFLQSLMDEFEFNFEETSDLVTISGVQNVENYETFIKSLTYKISNLNENEEPILINNKQFQLSCLRSEPNIQTNTVAVKLLLGTKQQQQPKSDGFIANKQMQRLVVGDDDDEILTKKTSDDSFSAKSGLGPMAVAFIVLCCCCTGFLLVFGVIRLHTSGYFGGRRKMLPNEENPQMEWDDSGLNITENPLEDLENKKRLDYQDNPQCQLDYEDEYSSGSESEEDGECHEFEAEEEEEEEEYSSEEEPEKRVGRELEWDDSTLELKIKDQKLKMEQQKQLHQQFHNNAI